MNKIYSNSDNDLIKTYFKKAVKDFKDEWFVNSKKDAWYKNVIKLPIKEKITYLIAVLDEEVMNGGFNQY